VFQKATASLVLTEVNAILPVIYETELSEFKKVQFCIAGPAYANLSILVFSQFGFFLPEAC